MMRDKLKPSARFAFVAGRELGWRDKWIRIARNETQPELRRCYAQFARACNHEYLKNLSYAIEAQPRSYSGPI